MRTPALGLLLILASAGALRAEEAAPAGATPPTPAPTPATICALIESAAAANRIPIDFFTRLIWKESTFRQEAVSPKGAQGIAQFMPATATLRGLADPFDAEQAIPKSAEYLGELVARFGNLGLAAAAYNAGEARVAAWVAGSGGMPGETRDYVFTITGRTIDEWAQPAPSLTSASSSSLPPMSCLAVAALLDKPGAGGDLVSATPQAARAPWGVQVAGDFSLSRAMTSYTILQKRYGSLLGAQPPMVLRTINRSRGTAPLFQIRVPAASADEANSICRKLHALGGACIVFRT